MLDFSELFAHPLIAWGVIPALIFLSRIFDVTIGTLRIIAVSRGFRRLAPLFGFFEVLLWLLVIKLVLTYVNNVVCYLAYAAGFSAGTWVGMIIEERICLGKVIVRVITRSSGKELAEYLRTHGYRITEVDARGDQGPVEIIFTIIDRQKLEQLQLVIRRFNPRAFYTVEDVRSASEKLTLTGQPGTRLRRRSRRPRRKGK
jgi:uncharacterized protein YebE (UPF0316 family)